MNSHTHNSADLPVWLYQLHRLVLWAEPDVERRKDAEAHWTQHFELLAADPTKTSMSLVVAACSSAASHVAWRISQGPPSAALPSLLVAAIGMVTSLFALSSVYTMLQVVPTAVAVSTAGLHIGRELVSPSDSRQSKLTSWALSVGSALNGVYYIAAPVVASDRLAGFGLLVISAGFGLLARSMTLPSKGRAWAFAGAGSMLIGGANLVAVPDYPDAAGQIVALAIGLLETTVGFALLRWAGTFRASTKEIAE